MLDGVGPFVVVQATTPLGDWRVEREADVVPWDDVLPGVYSTWREAKEAMGLTVAAAGILES